MSPQKEAASGLPQLGVRILADSNRWKCKTSELWDRCSGILSQLALTMSLHSLFIVLFSFGLWRTKFQVSNFLFSSLWWHVRGKYNVPTGTENL